VPGRSRQRDSVSPAKPGIAAMSELASAKAASKAGSRPGRTGSSACSRITRTTLRGRVGERRYRSSVPELIEPTTLLHSQWLASHDDWGPGTHEDGAGLLAEDDVRSPDGFAAWVGRLRRESDTTVPSAAGRVHCTYWWIVEGDTVLGAIALRHELNDFLLRAGGHIGYGIRPSARGRGLATWALGQVLAAAGTHGLDRVLITCADDNVASARVVEHHGGVLEDVRDTELGRTRRYWVALAV
jgi:predicted acetyltransferase